MPSWSSGITHARKTSGVADVERRCQEWHVVIALGNNPLLDDVGRCMIALSLTKTHNRTTWIVACHHHHWKKTTIRLRRAWHAIIALGQHTRSNDIEHGVPSSPLDNTHDHTTSGKARHLCPSTACTVKRRRAWHAHMGLGQHKLSDDDGCDMLHRPWETHTVRLC